MAQVKISALTAADPLTGVEEAPFVQGGATKKATVDQIKTYIAAPTVLDDLTDVDTTTAAPTDQQVLVFDSGSGLWVPADQGGGAETFLELTDTPAGYGSSANFVVRVNGAETALEFVDLDTLYAQLASANTFTGTQTLEAAAPELRLSETDTTDDNWAIKADASLLKVEEQNDLFATTGTHTTLTHGGGMQVGAPTGGDQGAGTVNAEGLLENGTGVAKLSGGDDADFTAMPQVGGDPIVESDSNAAGEFTRWADGTQECSRIGGSTTIASGAEGTLSSWTYPAAFIAPAVPTAVVASITNRGDTASETGSGWRNFDVANTATSSPAFIIKNNAPVSADYRDIRRATGQWK